MRPPGTPRVLACCAGMVILGGLERMMMLALGAVIRRGGAVHCLVNSWENETIVAAAERIGATWSIGPDPRRLHTPRAGLVALARNVQAICHSSAGLLRAAWRHRPSHILVPEFGLVLNQWLGLVALRLLGTRVILALQNAPAPSRFYARVWRWAVDPAVDLYVCASEAARQPLLACGIRASKTRVVYNCAPPREPATHPVSATTGRMVFVGQIIPQKGLDLLLDAVGLLVARGRAVTLDVVGRHDGWIAPAYEPFRQRIFERVARPDLAGRVRFLGFREDVPALMAAAVVHCIPSRPEMCEGFGIVVVEAKHAGIPTVAFHHGPFPELIAHRQTGWLCAALTPMALAEGLDHWLLAGDSADRRSLIRASAARFGHEPFALGWWNAFTEGTVATVHRAPPRSDNVVDQVRA